jgi:hypothetical protein
MACEMVCVKEHGRHELYVIYNGVCIAKRGYPESPQAETWVSIEPGFAVYDSPDDSIVIERNGVLVQ